MGEFLVKLWKKCQAVVTELLHGGYGGEFLELHTLDIVFEEELQEVGEIENFDKVKQLLYDAYFLGKLSQLAEDPTKQFGVEKEKLKEIQNTLNEYGKKTSEHPESPGRQADNRS